MNQKILSAAVRVAARKGIKAMSRAAVALEANCSRALVSYHARSMGRLRGEVVREAIDRENLTVLGHAIAERHELCKHIPAPLRDKAVKHHLAA